MNSKKLFAARNSAVEFFLLIAAIILFILAAGLFLMYVAKSIQPGIGKLSLG